MNEQTQKFIELANSIDRTVHFELVYEIAKIHHYSLRHNVIPLFEFGKNDGGLYRSEDWSIKSRLNTRFEEFKYRRATDIEFEQMFNPSNFRSASLGGRKNPPTGFAVVLGKPSNLVTLDFDTYATDTRVVIPDELKSSVMDKTPNGGTHAYFKWDESLEYVSTTSKKAKEYIYIPNNDKDFAAELLLNQLVLVYPSMVLSKDGTYIGQYEYTVGDIPSFPKIPKLTKSVIEKYLKRSELVSSPVATPVIMAQKIHEVTNGISNITTRQVQQEPSLLPVYLQQWHTDKLNLPEGASRHDAMLQIANSMVHYDFPDELIIQALEIAKNGFIAKDRQITDREILDIVRDAKINVGENKYKLGRNELHHDQKQQNKQKADPKDIPPPQSLGEVGKIRIEERMLEKVAPKTLYPELDYIIKGCVPKHLITSTGDTNAGKTTFACNLAVRVASQGKKVLYISLEPGTAVVDILASVRTGKKYSELNDDDILFDDPNIKVYTDEIRTTEDLRKAILQFQTRTKYDLIIIDHIGYFVKNDEVGYVWNQSDVLKELALFANDNLTCIYLIAHLRKPERSRKKNTNPTMDDISGTAAFKQDSDEVLILTRNTTINEHGITIPNDEGLLLVPKTKNSRAGSVKLQFFEECAFITSAKDNFQTTVNSKNKVYYEE